MRSGLVETYVDKNKNGARRFWVHERILCGGAILGPDDYIHLKHDFKVTGVLNVDNLQSDEGKGIEHLAYFPFPDDGNNIPAGIIHDCLDFAKSHLAADSENILYVHCALGGSRGPSMAYAVCRGVFKLSPTTIFESIKVGHPLFIGWKETWNPKQYIQDIEEALLIWPGQR